MTFAPTRALAALAAAAAALAGIAADAAAANRGVPLVNGDKVRGAIGTAADEDCFVLAIGRGAAVTISVKAAKGSSLLPELSLLRPDGTPLNLSSVLIGEGTSKLSIKNLGLADTGSWAVCVGGAGPSTGEYDLVVRFKPPKKVVTAGLQVAQGASVDVVFAGGDGASLTLAVTETSGGPLQAVDVLDPGRAAVPGAAALVRRKGKKVLAKNVPLQQGFGDYAARLTGAASGPTVVSAQTAVKFPRVARRKLVLGPEPVVDSLAPTTARDGTQITVTGSGFATGVRVFFGAAEATGVVVDSATQLRCNAPGGDDSTAGRTVDVIVQGTDGQEGVRASGFTYLGVPAVSAASPAFHALAGGGTITFAGTGFRPGATITIGGVAPNDVVVTPPNQITCTAPARPHGVAPVVVTDEFGRASAAFQGLVYLAPPVLSSASPATAPSHGGDEIALSGNGFHLGTRVFVDGVEVTPVTVSLGVARFAMPVGNAGPVTVQVMDGLDQTATRADILVRTRSFHDRSATSVPPAPAGTDFFASAIAIGDLDKDGDRDLIVASSYPRANGTSFHPASRVFRNNGSGVFTDVTSTRHAAFADPGDYGQADWVTIGDIDGDGAGDAILSREIPVTAEDYFFTRNSTQYAYYTIAGEDFYPDYRTYPGTQVLRNLGTGTLTNLTPTALPASTSAPFFGFGERWQGVHVLGDVDGDGKPDLVVAQPGYNFHATTTPHTEAGTTYLRESETPLTAIRLLKGSGTGSFTLVDGAFPSVTLSGSNVVEDFSGRGLAVGDLDGDQAPDIVVVRERARTDPREGFMEYVPAARVLLNSGTGTFTPMAGAFPTPPGDATPDSGEWWQGRSAALGDLDGDGDLDLVIGREYAYYWFDGAAGEYRLRPALRIFRNAGDGTFADATGSFLPASAFETGSAGTILAARHVRIGDVDGDGKRDVLTTGFPYYIAGTNGYGAYGILPTGYRFATRLLRNDGDGGLVDVTGDWFREPANGDWLQSSAIELGDLDGDGFLDVVLGHEQYPNDYYHSGPNNRPLRIFLSR